MEIGENGKKTGLMKIHAIISWQVIATVLLLGQEDVEILLSGERPCEPGLLAASHTPTKEPEHNTPR